MARRGRSWLRESAKVVNVVVIISGVAMIIYSLWLLKKWKIGLSHLHTHLNLPQPWFIQACLGVGISVCLTTLLAHILVNSTNYSFLICVYTLVICSLLLLEIISIVDVFFKINWTEKFSELTDERDREFKSFVTFNIEVCRSIVIIALVPQIYVIAVAIILWGIGGSEQMSYLEIADFRNSFLVGPTSSLSYRNLVIINNNSPTQNPLQSFVPYLIAVFRTRFPSTPTEIVA